MMRDEASQQFVSGIAQVIAIHIARNYSETVDRRGSPSLPGYKLKLTDWMAQHLAEDLNLDRLSTQVELSKFDFGGLFKRAVGISPSQYQIDLRMNEARRLLRETKKSILDVALDVGYTNPSHFAKLFRRENGLTPSEYRQQR